MYTEEAKQDLSDNRNSANRENLVMSFNKNSFEDNFLKQ